MHIIGVQRDRLRTSPYHLTDQVPGDPDVGLLHLPGTARPCPQIEPRLGTGKGHGGTGPDSLSQDLPGVPVYPGGQVAGHHRGPPAVHPPDCRQKVPLHRPLQTHSEQGVHIAVAGGQPDGQQAVLQIQGLQSAAGLCQPLLHGPGVWGHLLPVAHQKGADPIALLQQDAGGGDAVPAVVPRAAEYADPLGGVGVLGLHHSPYLVHLTLLLRRGLPAVPCHNEGY